MLSVLPVPQDFPLFGRTDHLQRFHSVVPIIPFVGLVAMLVDYGGFANKVNVLVLFGFLASDHDFDLLAVAALEMTNSWVESELVSVRRARVKSKFKILGTRIGHSKRNCFSLTDQTITNQKQVFTALR